MLKYCHCDEVCFTIIDLSNSKIHYRCATQNQIEIEKYEEKEKKKEKERNRKILKLKEEGLPIPSKKKKTNKKPPCIKENCGYVFTCDYKHTEKKEEELQEKQEPKRPKLKETPLSLYLKSLEVSNNNNKSNSSEKKKTFVTFKNNNHKSKIKKSLSKTDKPWLIKEPNSISNDENYIYFIPKIKEEVVDK